MRILLTGATGHLGPYVLREMRRRGLHAWGWRREQPITLFDLPIRQVDVADPQAVAQAWRQEPPTHVLHAAALSAIADCYRDPAAAQRVNVEGTRYLADLVRQHGARLLLVSTDLVFDGSQGNYSEADPPGPLSIYARSKLAAEGIVADLPQALMVRVSWLLGPKLIGPPRFLDDLIAKLRAGQAVRLFTDEYRSVLPLTWAARALVDALLSDAAGLFHLGGPERLSRYELGCRLAAHLQVPTELVEGCQQADVPAPEPRPRDVSLSSQRWRERFPEHTWPPVAQGLAEVIPPVEGGQS